MNKKGQIISMDFILTFVVYIFALSIFFFALKDVFYDASNLDLNSELMFNKISNVYNEYGFIKNIRVDSDILLDLKNNWNATDSYNWYFKDFENPKFSRMDYCIFLTNETGSSIEVLFNFDSWQEYRGEYSIFFEVGGVPNECGKNKVYKYENYPKCTIPNAESIILKKPVLYKHEIVTLNILVCADKIK